MIQKHLVANNLNQPKVQNLLEAMGLSQYMDAFFKEQVTGKILVKLTEQDLEMS